MNPWREKEIHLALLTQSGVLPANIYTCVEHETELETNDLLSSYQGSQGMKVIFDEGNILQVEACKG